MPTYSFGLESPIKFEISDKLAKNYNEAVKEYMKAQQRFNQKVGRRWDPVKDPIKLRWTSKHKKAWNDFAKIFDKVVKEQGPFHINDLVDDYLVKNAASAVNLALVIGPRYISSAAMLGALYGLLRGLK